MLYQICQALLNAIYALLFRLEAVGLKHIPPEGPLLLCSNHISNLDPMTVGVRVKRRVHYMAKAELFAFRPIGAFLRALGAFPVKRGAVSKDAIKQSLLLMKEGQVMGIFPEGTRNRGTDDGAGKKGAALIALRSGAAVVPVAIVGPYRPFRKLRVVYGPPVDLAAFREDSSSDTLDRATEKIMRSIRELVAEHRKA